MECVSDPMHSAWDLDRTPYIQYVICIGADTIRMGPVSGPIQSVWNLYRIPYTPYGICIETHTVRMGSLSDTIQLAWHFIASEENMYFFCGFCVRWFLGNKEQGKAQEKYRQTKANQKKTRKLQKTTKKTTRKLHILFAGSKIPCGLYGVR